MTNTPTHPVGKSATNSKPDVLIVQKFLNQKLAALTPLARLREDGVAGPDTLRAIVDFQKKVVGMPVPDGRIDPEGKRWKTLISLSAALVALPTASTYYRYSPSSRQFSTPETLRALQNIARQFYADTKVTFGIGDISFATGTPMAPHQSHRTGKDVDIRPLRKDKASDGVTRQSANYSRELTQKLVTIARDNSNLQSILFNDNQLKGVAPWVGHDNHLHLRFKK